jgi:hypothetical protein
MDLQIQKCVLCKSDSKDYFKSEKVDQKIDEKIDEKSSSEILSELLQTWKPEDLNNEEIDLLINYFSGTSQFCQTCCDKIRSFELLLQKVRQKISEFGKQLRDVLNSSNFRRFFDVLNSSNFGVDEKSGSSNGVRRSSRKRKKKKGNFLFDLRDLPILGK